jgi:nucleoredoxin
MVWNTFFGNNLLTKDGFKPTSEVLAGKKVVGIYFSAHWCPPCRGFTPVLATSYEDIKEEHPDFEIVFVSSDRDPGSFAQYYGEMPWVALPFENQTGKMQLAQKYGVQGIPMLIFLNEKGELITEDGRSVIASAQGDVGAIWSALSK